MEIEGVSNDLDFSPFEMPALWNGRLVTTGFSDLCSTKVMLAMGRPNRIHADVEGGYNQQEGKYVKGTLSLDWDLPPPKKETPAETPQRQPESPSEQQPQRK